MGEADLLWELQVVDVRTGELEERLASLAVVQQAELLRAEVEGLEQAVRVLRSEAEAKKKEVRRCELECRDLALARREFEERLYGGGVTNPKELEQLQKKIEASRSRDRELEERAISLMLEVDRVEGEWRQRSQMLQETRERWQEKEEECRQAAQTLRDELQELPARRQEIVSRLSPAGLATYEHLRRKKGGVAVAIVSGGVCGGCRVAPSLAVASEARRGVDLVKCENCGRILIWRS